MALSSYTPTFFNRSGPISQDDIDAANARQTALYGGAGAGKPNNLTSANDRSDSTLLYNAAQQEKARQTSYNDLMQSVGLQDPYTGKAVVPKGPLSDDQRVALVDVVKQGYDKDYLDPALEHLITPSIKESAGQGTPAQQAVNETLPYVQNDNVNQATRLAGREISPEERYGGTGQLGQAGLDIIQNVKDQTAASEAASIARSNAFFAEVPSDQAKMVTSPEVYYQHQAEAYARRGQPVPAELTAKINEAAAVATTGPASQEQIDAQWASMAKKSNAAVQGLLDTEKAKAERDSGVTGSYFTEDKVPQRVISMDVTGGQLEKNTVTGVTEFVPSSKEEQDKWNGSYVNAANQKIVTADVGGGVTVEKNALGDTPVYQMVDASGKSTRIDETQANNLLANGLAAPPAEIPAATAVETTKVNSLLGAYNASAAPSSVTSSTEPSVVNTPPVSEPTPTSIPTPGESVTSDQALPDASKLADTLNGVNAQNASQDAIDRALNTAGLNVSNTGIETQKELSDAQKLLLDNAYNGDVEDKVVGSITNPGLYDLSQAYIDEKQRADDAAEAQKRADEEESEKKADKLNNEED